MPLGTTLLYGFCSILTLALTVPVFAKHPKSKAVQMFFLFGIWIFIWMLSLYFGYFLVDQKPSTAQFLIRLAYGSSIWFPLFLSLFFYYFPKKTFDLPTALLGLLYGSSLALFLVSTFTPYVHESFVFENEVYQSDVFGKYYSAYTFYTLFQLFVAVGFAIEKIIHTTGIDRKRISIAASGLFVFYFLGLMTNVILPIFGIFILQLEAIAFTLCFLIPAFYAIQHYRFFDISYNLLKIIRKIILLFVFVASTGVSINLAKSIVPQYSYLFQSLTGATIGLLVFTILQKYFPELISKSFKEFRQRIRIMQSELFYTLTFQDLIQTLEKHLILELHLSNVGIYLVRKKKTRVNIPTWIDDDFTKKLEKKQTNVIISQELNIYSAEEKKLYKTMLSKQKASMCMPLYLKDKLIGLLFIGTKENNAPFNQEELNVLLNARKSIEIAFMNILLQSNLHEENNLMKQMIQEKTAQLQQQNNEIRKVLRQQSDFIAVTAHEFRTPLNIALFQLADTLESHDHHSQVLKDMKTMESSLEKLKLLTQNLFDVQQYDLDKATLNAEEINIREYLEEIGQELTEVAQKKELEIQVISNLHEDIFMKIDPIKIRQVIYNLFNNAKDVSNPGANIGLELKKEDSKILISVIDQGPGIPDNIKNDMFEKFRTTKASKGMGLGLGLYLCKKIMDLHKGNITVADTPGGGTTFTLHFNL